MQVERRFNASRTMAEVSATTSKEEEEERASSCSPVHPVEEARVTGGQGKDDIVLEKRQINRDCSPELKGKRDSLRKRNNVPDSVQSDATRGNELKGLQNPVTNEDHGVVEGTCSNKCSEVLKEKQNVVDNGDMLKEKQDAVDSGEVLKEKQKPVGSGGKCLLAGKKVVMRVEGKSEKMSAIVKKKVTVKRGKIDIPLRATLHGKRFVKLNRPSAFGSVSRSAFSEESACLKEMKKKFMAETGGMIEREGGGKKKGCRPDRFSRVRFVIREKNGNITQTMVKKIPRAGAGMNKARILIKKKLVGSSSAILSDNKPVSVKAENSKVNKKIITVDVNQSNKREKEKKKSTSSDPSVSGGTVQGVQKKDSEVDLRCTEKLTDEVSISYNINNTGWVNIKKEVTENMTSEGKKEIDKSQYSLNDMMKNLSNVMYKKTGPAKVARPNLKITGPSRITIGEAFRSLKPQNQRQQGQEQITQDNSTKKENSYADEVQIISEGSSQQQSFSNSPSSNSSEGSEIKKGQLIVHRNRFRGNEGLSSSGTNGGYHHIMVLQDGHQNCFPFLKLINTFTSIKRCSPERLTPGSGPGVVTESSPLRFLGPFSTKAGVTVDKLQSNELTPVDGNVFTNGLILEINRYCSKKRLPYHVLAEIVLALKPVNMTYNGSPKDLIESNIIPRLQAKRTKLGNLKRRDEIILLEESSFTFALGIKGDQKDSKEKRDLTLKMKELLCFTFQHEQFPTSSQIAWLAKLMGMPWSHIKKWFYRRRLENKKAGVYPRAQKMTFCHYCKVSLKTPEEQKTHLFLKSHIKSILGSSFDTSPHKRKEHLESKSGSFSVEARKGPSSRPAGPLVSEGPGVDLSQKGGETILASGFAINRDWQKEGDNRNVCNNNDDDDDIQEVARSITKKDLIDIDMCIEEMTERKRLEDEAKAKEVKTKEAVAKEAIAKDPNEVNTKANTKEEDAKEANSKETKTEEENVKQMDTKEANVKDTNVREVDVKEATTKEEDAKEGNAKENNVKEAMNVAKVNMKEETVEEEKMTTILGNSNCITSTRLENCASETPNTKGLKQICKIYTKWHDGTGGKVFGTIPPKLDEYPHPYVQIPQPVITTPVPCIDDSSSIGYKCPVCQKIFQSEWCLMKHSLFHRVFMCSLCASYHPSEANLKEHILQHLSDAFEYGYHKEFSCKVCRSLKCTCVMPNVYRPQAIARMYTRPQKAIRSKPFTSKPMAGPNDHLRVSFKDYKKLLRKRKNNLSNGADVKKLLGPAAIELPSKWEEKPPFPRQIVRTKTIPTSAVLSQPSTSNLKEEVSDNWKFKKPIKYVVKDTVSVPTQEMSSSQESVDLPKISIRSDLMPPSPPLEKLPHIPSENMETYFPSLAKARKKVKVTSKRPAKELSNNYIYKDTDFYYLCEMCDASFLSKAELNEHMFFHRLKARSRRGEKRGRVELQEEELEEPCNKSLKASGESVENVEKIVVSGFERFKCPMCKGHFASVQDLNRHRTQAHKEDITESQVPEDTKPKVTTFFKCKFCSKLYRREREFRRHLRRDCAAVPKSLKAKLTVGKTLFELPIPAEELPFTQVQATNDTFEQIETSSTPPVVNLDDESSIIDVGTGESPHKTPKWVVCKYCDRQFVRDRERRRHIWQYCTKAPPDVVKMLKAGAMLSQVDEYEGNEEGNTSVSTSDTSVQENVGPLGEMLTKEASVQDSAKGMDDSGENLEKSKEGSLSSSFESRTGMTADLDKEGNENDSFSTTDDGNESHGNSPKTFTSKRGRRGHSRCRFKKCYKVLPSPDILLAHMSLHTGPKNGIYRCKLCRAAKQKWRDLKEHVWMHTGETPYRCHICKTHYRLGNDIIDHFAKEHEIYITEKELTKWLPDSKGVYSTIKGEEEVLDLDSDLTFTAEIQVVTDQQLACMTDIL
ncbi:uncharacterized protein LOC143034590 isoform X2 [Oratosquilla oratoria]|uniref:uncharacterized protein LOC143034590 isoform X2 n=1 Tax=Oratosquilla oratoria TaxID=337810 RepID=UPI003F773628